MPDDALDDALAPMMSRLDVGASDQGRAAAPAAPSPASVTPVAARTRGAAATAAESPRTPAPAAPPSPATSAPPTPSPLKLLPPRSDVPVPFKFVCDVKCSGSDVWAKGELKCDFRGQTLTFKADASEASGCAAFGFSLSLSVVHKYTRHGSKSVAFQLRRGSSVASVPPDSPLPAWLDCRAFTFDAATPQSGEKFVRELEQAFEKSAFLAAYTYDEARNVLGSGAGGKVVLGTHRATNQRVAIKIPNSDSIALLDTEVGYMRQCQECKYIIRFLDVFSELDGEGVPKQYLVMEHADGGDLRGCVNARLTAATNAGVNAGTVVSASEVRTVAARMLAALAFMHERSIWHRDLKLDNILLVNRVALDASTPSFTRGHGDPCSAKLADLGHAKLTSAGDATHSVNRGTAAYWAPEQALRDGAPPRDSDTAKTDIWALGVTLVVLMSQSYPFGNVCGRDAQYLQSLIDLKQRIMSGRTMLSEADIARLQQNYPPSAFELLHKMLDLHPEKRPTAQQALSFSWFEGLSVEQLV